MIAKPTRQQVAKVESLPAPTGGLNARDPYANMPATDAALMDNMFPTPSNVQARNGCIAWVTSMPAVNTLGCYSPVSGSRKLFAAAGGAIYDVTLSGALGSAQYSGATTDWWQHVNFGAGGGQYLAMVNGQDTAIAFNGQGWHDLGNGTGIAISSGTSVGTTCTITTSTPHKRASGNTVTVTGATPAAYNVANAVITVTGPNTFTYTAGSAPGGAMSVVGAFSYAPAITGVSSSSFVNVNAYQGRLFFIAKNSMQVWFLPLLSVGGAATMLDLSSQTLLGGYLVAMATWAMETTSGSTEIACFITSEGEVIAYQGNDPSFASSWFRVGSFRIGRPVGWRCTAKIGSDVVVISADGLVPMSKAILTDRSQREVAISDKIQNLINNDVQAYSGYPGWQPILHPIGNKMIVNVPSPTGTYQYVMNTINGSWCRFTGWNANCWALVGDTLYFGSPSGVYQADTGGNDAGYAINCAAVQAPNYFGSQSEKQFTMARPVMASNGPINPAFQLNADFDLTAPTNYSNAVVGGFTAWGSPWGSAWSSASKVYKNWRSVSTIGYTGSPSIAFSVSQATVAWQSTDVAFQQGGVL